MSMVSPAPSSSSSVNPSVQMSQSAISGILATINSISNMGKTLASSVDAAVPSSASFASALASATPSGLINGANLLQNLNNAAHPSATNLSNAGVSTSQVPSQSISPSGAQALAAGNWAFSPSSTPSVSPASSVATASPVSPVASSGAITGGAPVVNGASIVSDATQYLGVPYQWGGSSPSTGFDCSGLVQKVFSDLGVSLPRTAAQQQSAGTPVASLALAQPGDLIFYGSPAYHVGIYVGNGKMIDAPKVGQSVQVNSVGTPTSIERITGATANPSLASQAGSYLPTFQAAATANHIDVNLLLSIAKVESNFNPNAVSSAGAQGMMQIMPSTASGLGINPMNPTQAIYGAAQLLNEKLGAFKTPALAAAAYNAGDNAVRAYGGIPPYPETQNYVTSVLQNMKGAAA